jgi:transposase-like protein
VAGRRRYTKREKATAVAEAERTSLTQAAESTGVPITTLKYWFDHDEFAAVRTKTREEVGQGSVVVAVLAQGELVRRIRNGTLSDQALVTAYGVAVDKAQLLTGRATERTEHVSVTDGFDDHEKRALAGILRSELARRGGRAPAGDPAGAAVGGDPTEEADPAAG